MPPQGKSEWWPILMTLTANVTTGRKPLIIGQFVTARIKGRALNNVFVIPNKALYQGTYVYVVENEAIKRRDISLAWQDNESSVINEGLASRVILLSPRR